MDLVLLTTLTTAGLLTKGYVWNSSPDTWFTVQIINLAVIYVQIIGFLLSCWSESKESTSVKFFLIFIATDVLMIPLKLAGVLISVFTSQEVWWIVTYGLIEVILSSIPVTLSLVVQKEKNN